MANLKIRVCGCGMCRRCQHVKNVKIASRKICRAYRHKVKILTTQERDDEIVDTISLPPPG